MSNKVLTIIGPSASIKEDIAKYGLVGDIMAVNRAIVDCPIDVKYAVSFHHDYMDLLIKIRKLERRNSDNIEQWTYIGHKHDHPNAKFFEYDLPINTSGLLALAIASKLNYSEVRVLGLSADASGHYYDLYKTNENYNLKIPYDEPKWRERFLTWKNIKVSSGNWLNIFPQILS